MFGNSLGDVEFLIINPGHYKAFSSLIPQFLFPPADAAPLEREGVVRVIGYRGRRMEIKPLAVCQQQPECTGVQQML